MFTYQNSKGNYHEYKITLTKSGVVSSFKISTQRAIMLQYIEGLTYDGIAFSFDVVEGY